MSSRLYISALLVFVFEISSAASQLVIFDTDFILPPGDDGLALLLGLQSSEITILGVSTVAGNASTEQATADVLWLLERTKNSHIPVYIGADMPWVHKSSQFAIDNHGEWYSDHAPKPPPGGFAKKQPEMESATSFLVRTVLDNPNQITIIAIGPLTNIATAISQHANFAENVKELFIMGGAIANLPDGAGNITPNAEFNFWVDPEAAQVVLQSGIPITLSPLNVSRKTAMTKSIFDRIISVNNDVTSVIDTTMRPYIEQKSDNVWLMYDQVVIGSLIDPTLAPTKKWYVDIDTHKGINYGTSVGNSERWPGAENARKISVQYDLDWPRFIEMFISRMHATPR